MTYSKSDAEHWARILNAMDYRPSKQDELRADAGSDGVELALQQAERFNCIELPSGIVRPGLGGSTVIRQAMDHVMAEHRTAPFRDVQEHRPAMPGVYLPTFDEGNPEHLRSLFAIFAGKPSVAHSMRYDTVEDLVERPPLQTNCYWRGDNLQCAEYAREVLCFSRGQYVVIFPTCFECKFWLLAGAPEPGVYAQMREAGSAQTAADAPRQRRRFRFGR